MTITAPPTAASMKLRFPEFADVSDDQVQFAVDEAGRNIDDTWLPKDKNLAWSYLAAHYLMVSIQRAASGTGQTIASERIGEISVTYAQPVDNPADMDDFETTSYGKRFSKLAQLNFPPIMVI